MWEEEVAGAVGGGKQVDASGKQLDALFAELMQECKHSAPGARLSARLRTQLERLRPETRRALVSRTREGCAPLFVAARRGNAELAEYLVHVCAAPLEQRGEFEAPAPPRTPTASNTHRVTPLWCAAVAGRLEVLRVLADAGADVDAASDSGSTPVRSACFMTHMEVVRFLVSRGADILRPNHSGGTCLINSVQSARLCAFLLAHGAPVDAQDTQLKTALHYAIQEHRVETARLLLEQGADPELRSRSGDDALRTACLKGAAQIVSLLMSRVLYSTERAADAYELLGATMLDEFNDPGAALAAWRRATALRHQHHTYVEKRGCLGPWAALGAAEWREGGELEALAADMDALRTQALLVAARVLGPHHKDTLSRLMYRGVSYADALRYQRCVELWSWALEIRIEKDTLLYTDTCQTLCAVTRLLLEGRGSWARLCDVRRVLAALCAGLRPARLALRPRPRLRRHADSFDRALRAATHLLLLLLATARTAEEVSEARRAVRELVAADVRSAHTGDTLLHLCVSRLNVIKTTYLADLRPEPAVFPAAGVVRLLLECGADPTVRNEARSTPLHVAAIPYNFSNELVQVLLSGGAHLDTPNKFGDSALELLALNQASAVRPLRHTSLACLAARVTVRTYPPHSPQLLDLPRHLHAFLDLHRQ